MSEIKIPIIFHYNIKRIIYCIVKLFHSYLLAYTKCYLFLASGLKCSEYLKVQMLCRYISLVVKFLLTQTKHYKVNVIFLNEY